MSTTQFDTLAIDMQDLTINLEILAVQANLPTLLSDGPSLPQGWAYLTPIRNENKLPGAVPVPTQGFLAKGPAKVIGDQGATVTTVAVLALGITWVNYLNFQFDGEFPQSALPAPIAGKGMPAGCTVMSVYSNAYQDLRAPIWNALQSQLAGLPLYICGMSLGAPLAQIAALDLRPGNTGPGQNQYAPGTASPCHTFSTGNIANKAMVTYYNSMVSSCTVHWAGTKLIPVDQFPLKPDNNDFAPFGTLDAISSPIPDTDVPWWERGDVYYLQRLGGRPLPNEPTPTNIPNPPAGFSQDLAFTLSKLTVGAYQMAQHPDGFLPPGNFTLIKTINANSVPFALVFGSPDTIAVAIRGCITWEEFNKYTADSNFSHPSFDPNGAAHVQKGAYTIYTSPVTQGTNSPIFSDELRKAISDNLGSKKLYIAGHSLGGAIANIAAADYVMGSSKLALTAVYTFGSIMVADYDFAQDFNAALGSKSYQIRRLSDKIANATYMIGYEPINSQVTLNGELSIDEVTTHSLYGYTKLLDTSRPTAKTTPRLASDEGVLRK